MTNTTQTRLQDFEKEETQDFEEETERRGWYKYTQVNN